MIRYAARAVPWPLVLASCMLTAALMAMVAAWPRTMWPLQGTAIGLIAGTAAWSLDETAAAVVDTLPRSLRWRTAARAIAVVPLALTWVGCVLVPGSRLPPHTGLFLLQGIAALLFALAFVTWRRARGEAVPGTRFASIVIPVAAMLALMRPLPDRLALFPAWPGEQWTLSLAIWGTLAVGSAALLAMTLSGAGNSLLRASAASESCARRGHLSLWRAR
jgi:hypothetical protein